MTIDWEDFLDPYIQAVGELKIKLRGIRKQYRKQQRHSPIEFVTGRVKHIESIKEKMELRGITEENLAQEMQDIAGLRVMVQFVDDVDEVLEVLRNRTDMRIVQERDYIKNKKASGYRSYHAIVEYPVDTINGNKVILAEIQIRTLSMNFWATIEHSLNYKYKGEFPEEIKLTTTLQDVINFGDQLDEVYYYREGKQNFYDQLKFEVTSQDTVYQWRRQYVRENKNGVVPTLTANMGTGGHNVPLILTDSGEIRKLTPKETFNVQGYPKSFQIPEEVSNGQLYKQAGNSVVVPVIKRIAERIAFALNESNGASQLDRSGKFAIIYTKMNGQFEGQSYVKDFVSTYEEAEKKIASYEDGLAILSDEDYFRLVKKRGNLEFYSII